MADGWPHLLREICNSSPRNYVNSRLACIGIKLAIGAFVRNPVSTKRALRAILKSSETCTRNPEQAASLLPKAYIAVED